MLKYIALPAVLGFLAIAQAPTQAGHPDLKISLKTRDTQPTVQSTQAPQPRPRPVRRRSMAPCPACGMG